MFLKRILMGRRWYSRPWVFLSPFLMLYVIISVANIPAELDGDEPRYVKYAENLLNGFLSPSDPAELDLWSGPGYSMFIAVFLFLKWPLVIIRVLNALLLFTSLLISFQTISLYASRKQALFYSVALGLYYPVFEMLHRLYTECLTWFLISLVVYLFLKYFKQSSKSPKYIALTSLAIAFLALTKVIFGYVIVAMLIISLFLCLIPNFRSAGKKSTLIFLFSLVFCLPYLFYTYSLTNKVFYWANSGGMSLYTMSSPFEDELGDWKNNVYLMTSPNHSAFADSIYQLNPLERDEAFKTKAIENIKNHPTKYLKNWTANVNRFLFSFPFSHTNQTMKLNLFANMFIIVFILLAGVFAIIRYKRIPTEIILLLLFALIYSFGSSLVSTYLRMFYISVPFWIVFISYVFTNIVSIRTKKVG